jgi:hypothetical protein
VATGDDEIDGEDKSATSSSSRVGSGTVADLVSAIFFPLTVVFFFSVGSVFATAAANARVRAAYATWVPEKIRADRKNVASIGRERKVHAVGAALMRERRQHRDRRSMHCIVSRAPIAFGCRWRG